MLTEKQEITSLVVNKVHAFRIVFCLILVQYAMFNTLDYIFSDKSAQGVLWTWLVIPTSFGVILFVEGMVENCCASPNISFLPLDPPWVEEQMTERGRRWPRSPP